MPNLDGLGGRADQLGLGWPSAIAIMIAINRNQHQVKMLNRKIMMQMQSLSLTSKSLFVVAFSKEERGPCLAIMEV